MNRTVENATVETFRHIRKNAIRDKYELFFALTELCAENPTDDPAVDKFRTDHLNGLKAEIRRMNHTHTDRFGKSLLVPHNHRYVYPYGDSEPDITEFWYEPDNGKTDEEIDEAIESLRIECRGSYGNPDGAGMPFTARLEWKRTPYGIRIIHQTSLNI